MKIKYIGLKARKEDNVAGTGLTWRFGETLEVEDQVKAAKLLAYERIWVADGGQATAPAPAPAPSAPAPAPAPAAPVDLTVDEVREALKAKGVSFHPNTGEAKLRSLLAQHQGG